MQISPTGPGRAACAAKRGKLRILGLIRGGPPPHPRHPLPPLHLQPPRARANAHPEDASNTRARRVKLRHRKQLTSRRRMRAGDARAAVRHAAASGLGMARAGDSIEMLCRRPTIARLKSASPGEFKSLAI